MSRKRFLLFFVFITIVVLLMGCQHVNAPSQKQQPSPSTSISLVNKTSITEIPSQKPIVKIAPTKLTPIESTRTINDFNDWILPGYDKELPKNQFFILYLIDDQINAVSMDGKIDIQISSKTIKFAKQASYDGKVLELFNNNNQSLYVDLEKKTILDQSTYHSSECHSGITSPNLKWFVEVCGDNADRIDFVYLLNQKRIFSLKMPKTVNDFPNWSYDGNILAYVQADLDIMDQNQPGSIYLIDTSCIDSSGICAPKVIGSFTPPNYPMWGGTASSWSPDNQFLAFVSSNFPEDIQILNVNTMNLEKIDNNENEVINQISWSPDGGYLLINEGKEIKVINLLNKNIKLVKGDTFAYPIGWLSTYPRAVFETGRELFITGAGSGLKIHMEHDLKSKVKRKLETNENIVLLEGPVDSESKTWWKIKTTKDNMEGWVVTYQDWFAMK